VPSSPQKRCHYQSNLNSSHPCMRCRSTGGHHLCRTDTTYPRVSKHLWPNEIAAYLSSKGVRLIASGKEVLDDKAMPVFLQQQDVACSIIWTALRPSALSIGSDIADPICLLGKLWMEYAPSTSAYLMEVGMKLLNGAEAWPRPCSVFMAYFREINSMGNWHRTRTSSYQRIGSSSLPTRGSHVTTTQFIPCAFRVMLTCQKHGTCFALGNGIPTPSHCREIHQGDFVGPLRQEQDVET
jgi:hypothetical protein